MQNPVLTVFYDSMCPACSFEVDMLKRKDTSKIIRFIDITKPEFDPSRYGLSMEQVIGSIHGLDASGKIVSGMELFRQIYRVLGMGWVWSWTALPGLKQIADGAYGVFAKIRPRFSRFEYQCEDRCGTGRILNRKEA